LQFGATAKTNNDELKKVWKSIIRLLNH
jgi:hypothetical protein